MKLHEEFKLYENLWEDVGVPSTLYYPCNLNTAAEIRNEGIHGTRNPYNPRRRVTLYATFNDALESYNGMLDYYDEENFSNCFQICFIDSSKLDKSCLTRKRNPDWQPDFDPETCGQFIYEFTCYDASHGIPASAISTPQRGYIY